MRATMENELLIRYRYDFGDGPAKTFDVKLDRATLRFVAPPRKEPLLWTLLTVNQCGNCPLDVKAHTCCPVALNFADIAEHFSDVISHQKVRVVVSVDERMYAKDTVIQQGLTPLLGIIMTTSGCPVMEPLKPMVRFHLPFASLTETVFRMVSMYLVAQHLRRMNGKPSEDGIDGLAKIYSEVNVVNRDFAKRLREAAKKDANVNALVGLDCLATMVPLAAEETLKEIAPYFEAYLK
jgi:hypothetical protein